MSTYLVTGSEGFIGSHLCTHLEGLGHEVRHFDVRLGDNITELMDCLHATEKVDYVLHHAGLTSVPESFKQPWRYYEVNTIGTCNIVEAAIKNKVKHIVVASSSSVYGSNPGLPRNETTTQPLPSSPYGVSKLAAEKHAVLRGCTALRYGGVWGPRSIGVVSKFVEAARNGHSPTIYGDGKQTDDFVHVDDICRANVLACKGPSGVYNIGTGVSTNLLDLCKILGLSPSFKDKQGGFMEHSVLSISKAHLYFGYSPTVSIDKVRNLV